MSICQYKDTLSRFDRISESLMIEDVPVIRYTWFDNKTKVAQVTISFNTQELNIEELQISPYHRGQGLTQEVLDFVIKSHR